MYSFRFRGGIYRDSGGWGLVVLIDGIDGEQTRYTGEERYPTEQEAESRYKELRETIMPILKGGGLTVVDNLAKQGFAPAQDDGAKTEKE